MAERFSIALFSLFAFLLLVLATFFLSKDTNQKSENFSLKTNTGTTTFKEILVKSLENKDFFNADFDYLFSKNYIEKIRKEPEIFENDRVIIGEWFFKPDSGYFQCAFSKGHRAGILSGYINQPDKKEPNFLMHIEHVFFKEYNITGKFADK